MSMDSCDKCSNAIDTDFDLECYRQADTPQQLWENHTLDGVCICEWCRETMGLDQADDE